MGLLLLLFINLKVQAETSLSPALVARINLEKIYFRSEWIKLLYYQKLDESEFESSVDDSTFFLSGDGRIDPKKELLHEVEIFQSLTNTENEINDAHPLCRFPARFQFIQRTLFPTIELSTFWPKCPQWQAFEKKFNLESASLVFSSYHVGVPASAFGHTLLRFGPTKKINDDNELFDQAVNFSAVLDTENPVVYAIKGITGLFVGSFTSMPYAYKIREYNDYESRDLWSIELNLNLTEKKQLIAHLWEIGHASIRYYYLTKNCSYYMLALIEAARPSLNLLAKLPFYTLPIDTLKVLKAYPELIKEIHYRPSLRKKFEYDYSKLKSSEKKLVIQLSEGPELSQEILKEPSRNIDEQAKILDTAIELYDLKNSSELIFEKGTAAKNKRPLLLARSDLATPSSIANPLPHSSPLDGHDSRRTGVNYGYWENQGKFLQLTHRFALHDVMDNSLGQPENASLDFGKLKLRIVEQRLTQKKKFYFEDLTLIEASNFPLLKAWEKPFSWRLKFGIDSPFDRGCYTCQVGSLQFGAGGSLSPHPDNVMTLLLNSRLDYSSQFAADPLRIGIGPSFLIRHQFPFHLKTQIQIGINRYLYFDSSLPHHSSHFFDWEWRYQKSPLWSLSTQFTSIDGILQIPVGLNIYY